MLATSSITFSRELMACWLACFLLANTCYSDGPTRLGHSVLSTEDGKDYIYYCHPLPLVRVRATQEAVFDPTQYETYRYIQDGSNERNITIVRDRDGALVWKWRTNSVLPTRELEEQLVRQELLAEQERAFRMSPRASDRRWTLHTSSIAWNDHRSRWVMIGLEAGGESS